MRWETREPGLTTLLAPARLADICEDLLIDGELELPAKLPSKPKH